MPTETAAAEFRPFDLVTVTDDNVKDWAGLIVGEADIEGWYWFVPLDRERPPKLWPANDGLLRFPPSEITLVQRWTPYPPDAPYAPEFQVWLLWMSAADAEDDNNSLTTPANV